MPGVWPPRATRSMSCGTTTAMATPRSTTSAPRIDGTTWGADKRLTTDASWSERPSVAVHGSVIHVVWYDGRLGPPRIFYKHSLDNGTTWGPDVCLTPTVGVGYHPSVAVSGSIVHVAWTDMSAGPQIYYTRSLDNGTTWEAAKNITPAAPPAGKNLASIAVAGSIVHVTWMDTRGGPQIYYTRSLDSWRDLGDGQEHHAGAVAVCLGGGFRCHRPCRVCGFPLRE